MAAGNGTAAPLRTVWLCADDYGIAPGVNRGIRDLIARGRLSGTSVMVTAPGFSTAEAQALTAAAAGRRAAVGLHFTVTAPFRPASSGFRPLGHDGAFPRLARMFASGLGRSLDPALLGTEAEAQFAAFEAAFGGPPDYVDGHQHVQVLPQVGDALLAVMTRRAPRAWLRQCGRAVPPWRSLSDPKGLLIDRLSVRLRARCAKSEVATNPAFAGTYDFSGAKDYEALFGGFLRGLPDGSVVMCHPGFVDDELRRLDPFTDMREHEHAFFAGERFPAVLTEHGIALAHGATK